MKVLLSDGGKSLWTVVCGADLSETEEFAVKEFVEHFKEMTGISLRIS